jgi:hypothetical protein
MCGVCANMGAVSHIDKDTPNPKLYRVSGIAVIQPIVMQPTETAYPKARPNIFAVIPEETASAAYDGSGQLLVDWRDEVREQGRRLSRSDLFAASFAPPSINGASLKGFPSQPTLAAWLQGSITNSRYKLNNSNTL